MKIFFFTIFYFLILNGCQQKATRSIEEVSNVFTVETVLVDTRSAFLFASGNIRGSINLESRDFIILKNVKTKKRVFDPDLKQTNERLAKKGIHPSKKVFLIGDSKNSDENKKWSWLLKLLEIDSVETISFDEFKKEYKNTRYANPSREEPWEIKLSPELQQEFIFKKAPDCFVVWSPKKCLKN